MAWKPKHRQVHYTTLRGENVTVDEGMFDVLMYLRTLGVETQYSCENENDNVAYVLVEAKGASRLFRRMLKLYIKGDLSPESRRVVKGFIKGSKDIELSHFTKGGRDRVFNQQLRFGHERGPRYSYERTLSTTYGNRITLRWPTQDTKAVERLLDETLRSHI